MANFIVEFPLKTEPFQEDELNKRFEIGRKMYNAIVNISKKRYNEMVRTRKYRELMASLNHNMEWRQSYTFSSVFGSAGT